MSLRSVLASQRAIRLSDLRKRVTCDGFTSVTDAFWQRLATERVPKETGSAEADPQAAQCSYASPTTTTRTYSRPRSSLSCSRSPRAPSDVGLIRERCRRFGRSAVSGGSGGERFGAWSPKGGRPFLYLNKRPVPARPLLSALPVLSGRRASRWVLVRRRHRLRGGRHRFRGGQRRLALDRGAGCRRGGRCRDGRGSGGRRRDRCRCRRHRLGIRLRRPVNETEQDRHGPEADEQRCHPRKRKQDLAAADPLRERAAAFLIGCRFGRFRGDVVLSLRRTVDARQRDGLGRLVHGDPACTET